jgi:glucose/arabinose dehydrogenase
MFDSKLNHKLSFAAALLGLLTAAGCAEQPATVANSQSAHAASSAADSASPVNPASPAADSARAGTASPGANTNATQPLHLVTLPKGTEITATVRQTLNTDKNRRGDVFSARLAQPVKVNGKTVLPRGTAITGRITKLRTYELKVALSSVVVDGIYCDLDTNSRRPSDKEPKPINRKQYEDNSTLSAKTRLTFKLSKPAIVPGKA